MGRPKSTFIDLPPRMTGRRMKSGRTLYYLIDGGAKIPLGSDREAAIRFVTEGKVPPIRSHRHLNAGDFGRPTLRVILASAIPVQRVRAVYFLIREGVVVYVGRSDNLYQRLQSHLLSEKVFDSYGVLECSDQRRLNELEAYYIALLRPEYNAKVSPRDTRDFFRTTQEPLPA